MIFIITTKVMYWYFICRDKLLGAVTNGFRFDGNGVVVLDRDRFRPSKASMISLKFKTYADNGLMLLVGEDRDFMSLELRTTRRQGKNHFNVILKNKYPDNIRKYKKY